MLQQRLLRMQKKLFHDKTAASKNPYPRLPGPNSVNIVRNKSIQSDFQRMSSKRDLPSQQNFSPRQAANSFGPPAAPPQGSTFRCNSCNGLGHFTHKCPSLHMNPQPHNPNLTCYECQGFGHCGQNCPTPQKRLYPSTALFCNRPPTICPNTLSVLLRIILSGIPL